MPDIQNHGSIIKWFLTGFDYLILNSNSRYYICWIKFTECLVNRFSWFRPKCIFKGKSAGTVIVLLLLHFAY